MLQEALGGTPCVLLLLLGREVLQQQKIRLIYDAQPRPTREGPRNRYFVPRLPVPAPTTAEASPSALYDEAEREITARLADWRTVRPPHGEQNYPLRDQLDHRVENFRDY